MKKFTTLLMVLFGATLSLFAQTNYTYCDSVFVEYSTTISGTSVKFSPKVSSITKPEAKVLAQEWNFGDGTAGTTTMDPTHDYTKPGTYTPCITVKIYNPRNPNSPCIKKYCGTVTISDPCDRFTPDFNYTIGTNGVVVFEASSSNSSVAYKYSWDFGDNTTGVDRVITHTFKAGTYKVCVTIFDPATKCTKVVCKEITVKGSDPCADFNPSMNVSLGNDGVLTFEASVGTNYTYSWSFGDGTSSSDRTGKHTYKAGTYKLCVTITNPTTKCTKTLCKEITVAQKDPCADFNPTFKYEIGSNGGVVFYGANSTTNTYSYTWSYGDGTSGTGGQTTHTYKPGTYKACVTIYDAKTGCKKLVCAEITITGTNTDPCKDFNPTFNYKIDGTVVIVEGANANYTYAWSFGNNVVYKDRIVKYNFQKPGSYKICVVITDPKTKCSKTICKEIVIKPRETNDPCKNFNPKVSFQTDGLKVKLGVDGGKGATMEWNFGDGTKGSKDNVVTHTYAKAGKYTICVTVYDAKRACKKTICFTIEVQGKTTDPCANFNPDFTFTVNGNKLVVEASNLTGVEYIWNWGDKLGSKGRVADHVYKVAGKYNVCVTAYDPKTNCTKTICKTIALSGLQKMIEQGSGDDSKKALMIYPNPVDTRVTVVTSSSSDAAISVKDIYGNEVLKYNATPGENNSFDMMVESLPKGTYYMNVIQDGKVEYTKFVK